MQKQKFSRDLLILSILTVITVFSWIGFEVYHALTKTEIPSVLRRQIEPLNPTIEKKILQGLKSRKSLSTEELVTAPVLVEKEIEEEGPSATEGGEVKESTPSAE